jgi:hypothetical protein
MLLMRKNNLFVKTASYMRRTEILKNQISIYNSALSVSSQSRVIPEEKKRFCGINLKHYDIEMFVRRTDITKDKLFL